METKLRQMLQDRAGQVRAPEEIPGRTLSRARRRRAGMAGLGTVTALLIGLAGYAGIRATGGGPPFTPGTETPSVTPSQTPGPVEPGTWRGIWPREGAEEAEAVQTCADAGDPDCTWRIEVEGFVENFASQALGWDRVRIGDDVSEPDLSFLELLITDCTDECYGGLLVEITVERLVRQDDTGIWSVTQMGQVQHFTDAICEDCPVTADEVRLFVEEFLRRRQMEVGAEAFLAPEALERYRTHEGGLVLYPFEVDSYGEGFEVVSVFELVSMTEPEDLTHWVVEVRLDMVANEGDIFSSMHERLVVDPTSTERPFGYPELIVVGAERLDDGSGGSGDPTDGALPSETELRATIDAFMQARQAGEGAEAFLAEQPDSPPSTTGEFYVMGIGTNAAGDAGDDVILTVQSIEGL